MDVGIVWLEINIAISSLNVAGSFEQGFIKVTYLFISHMVRDFKLPNFTVTKGL